MAVTVDRAGPYTSPKVIIDLILRHRDRGLPQPVDAAILARAGVSDSLIPRTLQALNALDLVAEDGRITEVFDSLRLAPQGEFQERVGDWLNAAYADVLQFADPSSDDDTKVRDAFRNYKPVGQQDRMVTLFLRLYEFAGITLPQAIKAPSRPRSQAVQDKPRIREVTRTSSPPRQRTTHTGDIPPPIAGLLARLPAEGEGWTKERRDGLVAAFEAVIDFCFPIVTATQAVDAQDCE